MNNQASAETLNVEVSFLDAGSSLVDIQHFIIVATADDPNAPLTRLLPEFPASGSRAGKVVKFIGDTLTWVTEAIGLPTLPASGSRDGKVPKFDGDVLKWLADGGGSSGEAVPVFAEVPIVINQALANRASAPTHLNLGTPSNVLNNSGEIEVSGGNALQLGAGAYFISLSLMTNDRSGTSDARTTFMAALYDSGGSEIQKIEPLVGYNRNISTNMTRVNHTGDFLVNMTSAGAISVRAKVFEVGDDSNPAHTTLSGAAVRIFNSRAAAAALNGLP